MTAAAGDVLANKVFVDATGAEKAGTMANNGAVAATIDGLTTTSYTVPAGYHNGSGTGGLVWTAGTASDVTSNTVEPYQFYIIRMASSTSISGNVHIQVKGKWK